MINYLKNLFSWIGQRECKSYPMTEYDIYISIYGNKPSVNKIMTEKRLNELLSETNLIIEYKYFKDSSFIPSREVFAMANFYKENRDDPDVVDKIYAKMGEDEYINRSQDIACLLALDKSEDRIGKSQIGKRFQKSVDYWLKKYDLVG